LEAGLQAFSETDELGIATTKLNFKQQHLPNPHGARTAA
jgi:hypothetical protein